MRKQLASVLRMIAQRLDPTPLVVIHQTNVFPAPPTSSTAANVKFNLTHGGR